MVVRLKLGCEAFGAGGYGTREGFAITSDVAAVDSGEVYSPGPVDQQGLSA